MYLGDPDSGLGSGSTVTERDCKYELDRLSIRSIFAGVVGNPEIEFRSAVLLFGPGIQIAEF